MTISGVGAVDAIRAMDENSMASASFPAKQSAGGDFASIIESGLAKLDVSLKSVDQGMQGLAIGSATPLHEVVISMEQARLDLMLAVEVRNKLVEAYQELSRMQL